MKKYVPIILFFVVLALPLVLRQFVAVGTLTQSASKVVSGDVMTLVVITPHSTDIRREFGAAFTEWYQDKYHGNAQIDFRNLGGTNDVRRLLETSYRSQSGPDGKLPPEDKVTIDYQVVWGGGDYFFDHDLKSLGILQPLKLDPAIINAAFPQPTLAGVKLLDQSRDKDGKPLPPKWVGVCLSTFGIVYNPDLMDQLGVPAPKAWNDLTDPRLAGLLALADPTHSGSVAVAYLMVIQRAMADAEAEHLRANTALAAKGKQEWAKDPGYNAAIAAGWKNGMRQLVLIAANARYFTDSATQVPNDVSLGDAAAGVAIDFYGHVVEETVGPRRLQFILPERATAITPDPVAILYGTRGQQLQLAQAFVEFLLSPQAQRLWDLKPGTPGGPSQRALRRLPIRQDVYKDQTNWADPVNPFTSAQGFNQRGEWMGLFTDTRPLWAAAWIDDRDGLKSAYDQVLAVHDPSRRAALISELSDIPVSMQDVAAIMAERSAQPLDKVEEWKARSRIEWAKKFRDHYAAVAAKASAGN
jgi:ABC-type Fe3+ transport system substrate-binding protein